MLWIETRLTLKHLHGGSRCSPQSTFGVSWLTAQETVQGKFILLHMWVLAHYCITGCMLSSLLQTNNSAGVFSDIGQVFVNSVQLLWVLLSFQHPAAAAPLIQVSSCPGKSVSGFWSLSEQVQWIIFLCVSLSSSIFPSFLSPHTSLKAGSWLIQTVTWH